MFSFQGYGSSLGAKHDPEKERDPPAPPTTVTFPAAVRMDKPPVPWTDNSYPNLFRHFSELRKLSDVKADILEALNISIPPPIGVEELIPSATDYLPPESWLKPPESSADPSRADFSSSNKPYSRLLCNGRPVPDMDIFSTRLQELRFDNYDAFSALSRTPMPDRPKVRLAHFRRFWDGLDNMAYYWDVSQDHYIYKNSSTTQDSELENDFNESAAAVTETEGDGGEMSVEKPRKRAKMTPTPPPVTESEDCEGPVDQMSIDKEPNKSEKSNTSTGNDASPVSYKGLRIGCGADMPEMFRVDTVRSFVEGVAWAFGCTVSVHRRPPLLAIERLMVPVRITAAVWQTPDDRTRARAGFLKGPIMGIQCRDQVGFKTEGEQAEREAVLDLVREVGGLLSLAQERARAGRTEKKPGEGMWWTEVPRWGGGTGGEIGNEAGNTDEASAKEEKEKESKKNGRQRHGEKSASGSSRRKQSAAEAWKTLRPGTGYWDPKVEYDAVGKEENAECDDVFLVSSLNHHVSLLRLNVHQAYLDFLSSGELPESPRDNSWCSPTLRRTRWFDLLQKEDRVEVMHGLWGVMAYLMRSPDAKDDDVAMGG